MCGDGVSEERAKGQVCTRRLGKVGGMVSMLGEVRRMMGEEAAMLAYRGFIRSVLGFGCEVMVWDRVGIRMISEREMRKI